MTFLCDVRKNIRDGMYYASGFSDCYGKRAYVETQCVSTVVDAMEQLKSIINTTHQIKWENEEEE